MGISKDILKRIKVVENALSVAQCPELIMICYEESKKKYIVNETYINDKGEATKHNYIEVDMIQDYVFAPKFMGVCIMDLIDAPVSNPNLYNFQGEEVRKKEKIASSSGFRIAIDEEQPSDRTTSITVKKA